MGYLKNVSPTFAQIPNISKTVDLKNVSTNIALTMLAVIVNTHHPQIEF